MSTSYQITVDTFKIFLLIEVGMMGTFS